MAIAMEEKYRTSDRIGVFRLVEPDEATAMVRAFLLGQPVSIPDLREKADDVTSIRFFEDR